MDEKNSQDLGPLSREEAESLLPHANSYSEKVIPNPGKLITERVCINASVDAITTSRGTALFDKFTGIQLTPWFANYTGFAEQEEQTAAMIEISIPYLADKKYQIFDKDGKPITSSLTTISGIIDAAGNPISMFTDKKTGVSYSAKYGILSAIAMATFAYSLELGYSNVEPTCAHFVDQPDRQINGDALEDDKSYALRAPMGPR